MVGPAVGGMGGEDQAGLDRRLIEVDGTRDKSRLGANAILGVSCAVARAAAVAKRIPLWRHLASLGGTAPLKRRGQTTQGDGVRDARCAAQAKACATPL